MDVATSLRGKEEERKMGRREGGKERGEVKW